MLIPQSPAFLEGLNQDGVESGFHFVYIRRRYEIKRMSGTSGVFRQVVSQIHFVFFRQCIMKLDGHSLVIHCPCEGIFNIEYEQVLHSLLGHCVAFG
jgi:hypothetical protein